MSRTLPRHRRRIIENMHDDPMIDKLPEAVPAEPVTAERRAAFDRDGYVIIRGALAPDELAAACRAIDRVYAEAAKAGALGPDRSMHLLSAVTNCPEVACLIEPAAAALTEWPIRSRCRRWPGRSCSAAGCLPHYGASAAR
jgi:hypothetical protein